MKHFIIFVIGLMSVQLLFAQTYNPSAAITYSGQSNIVIDGKSFTTGTSGASIYLTNCTNVKIVNCKFVLTKDIIGIQLNSCSNIEISNCYFENFRTGVYAVTCTGGINIHCNSFKNIAGIKPRGQIVQFNKCYGAGNKVNYNILDHEYGSGTPEDLINMYGSYGTTTDPIQIIGNKLRGGGPSTSGGGIMIGDDGGHDMRVEDNILVDVGQYGIGAPAGYNMTISNNKIYGPQQTWSNVGLYVGLQGEVDAGFACTGNTIQVKNNQVKFYRKDGVPNGWYNCPCCSGVVQSGNNFNASITASILPTVLQLDENNCPLANQTPALSCTTVPADYESVYCRDFETTATAGNYLKTDAWYFYWGGTNSTSYSNPELDKRFLIKTDPKNTSNKTIQLIKFNGDKDYTGGTLNPRTELSFRPSLEQSVSKEVYIRVRTFFPANQLNVFAAEFIQFWLHGATNIPLQIEVRNGIFNARGPWGYTALGNTIKLENNLDKWITWEVKAKFNNNGGYWMIYMDGNLVYTHSRSMADWPSNTGTWHPQFGIYSNNGGAGQMECYFDDFMVAEKNQTIANTPPTISISSPANNATFSAPASISIIANADDTDGTVSKVEFFNGTTKLGEKTASPFTYSWTNVAEGTYSITAKATDNKGAVATSTVMSLQVLPATWRSKYYPETWTPPTTKNFYTDAFLQDYSYAGYHRGEKDIPTPIGTIYDVTKSPYNADKTGATDATTAIQNAINAAQTAGGGIVYLPAGTYKLNPGTNTSCLRINNSNIVFKGDGIGKTFLLNTSYKMNNKAIISVSGSASWTTIPASKALITSDLMNPTTIIPIDNPLLFKKGDIVMLRNSISDAWITEHNESGWIGYGSNLRGIMFCREIVAVDATNKTITIDIPIRYALKTRDESCVFKLTNMVSEVGLQDFSIANVQHPGTTGWGEEDYTTSTNASYDCSFSYVIKFNSVMNSWMKNVATYQPAGNTTKTHMLSNGVLANNSKNITIDNCTMSYAQYGGGGGNGYGFRSSANEILIKNSTASYIRHGFVFSSMWCSGNVIYKCNDIKTGFQCGNTGNMTTSGWGSDHHMHFSQSNLIDQSYSENSAFVAFYRPYGSAPLHNLTSTHTAFWNISSGGSKGFCIWTQQSRYGYAIGTSGTSATIKTNENSTGSAAKTNPVDITEGQGLGATLVPQSLYVDQLNRRISTNVAPTISITAPVNNASFLASSTVTITANATDSDGSISKVEFFNGTTKLGESTSSPYTYSWISVVEGTYSITAKATDNKGAITASTAITVTVITPPTINALQIFNETTHNVVPELDSLPQTYSFSTNMLQGTQHNIYAEVLGAADSVVFVYTKNGIQGSRKEITAPYATQGDGAGYTPWVISSGTYIITATTYKLGVATSTKTSSFTVHESVAPGIIEAEHFNVGIQGEAYSDIDAINQGKEYRKSSGVDIQVCTDGGYNIAWIANGEWLQYTLNVQKTASYKVKLRVASTNANGRLQISQNGKAISPIISIPNTGGWQIWKEVVTEINLSQGLQTIQCNFITGSFNFDSFECIELITQTISLQKGWNLISTNVNVQDSTIQNLFVGLDVAIVKNAHGFWKQGQSDAFNSLKSITSGQGYLVHMNVAGNLVVSGTPLIINNLPLTINSGWNLIGYPGCTDAMHCVSIPFLKYFNSSNCQTIKNFDGFWIPNGTTNSIQNFEPGKGYFVKK